VEKLPETAPSPYKRLCLIGEADLFIARLLRRYAATCELRTECAQTGEDLLDWLQGDHSETGKPALLVIDPELPGKMRGWEVVRAIQERYGTTIPIVLCAWLDELESWALVGQNVPHLQKPDVHYEDFVSALVMVGVSPGTPDAAGQR
jgi:CheY-like chemotaxis protein